MKVYLLWLWRDVEHVEVDDSAHDAVAAQVELELVAPDLDQSEVSIVTTFNQSEVSIVTRRPPDLVHVYPLLQLLLRLGGRVLVLLPHRRRGLSPGADM